MDVYIFISVLSVMYSWILCTVLSAPAGETTVASAVTQRRHVRTKRCSCSTFLDKECVYFCHLDIIWVNTPERVVSYGLGDAPRTRRAAPGSMATGGGPRCRCRSGSDHGCGDFCRTDSRTRYEASPDATSGSAGGDGCTGTRCKHKLAADAGGVKRVRDGDEKQASPLALRAAART